MVRVHKEGFAPAWVRARFKIGGEQRGDLVLKAPVVAAIEVVDAAGQPVAGARVREIKQRGAYGEVDWVQMDLRSLGIKIAPSDESGRLTLPTMPAGDRFQVVIEHPRLAPMAVAEQVVGPGVVAHATMVPGVTLTLRVPTTDPAARITSAVLDLRRKGSFEHPSTLNNTYEVDFNAEGITRLVVAPGTYETFLVQHDDFYLTPCSSDAGLSVQPGQTDDLAFTLQRKVRVRGRLVEARTGRPVARVNIRGEIATAPSPRAADGWSFAAWSSSQADGSFEIPLAEGLGRIAIFAPGMKTAGHQRVVTVAADGTTVLPPFEIWPLPTLTGVVQDRAGTPVAGAVVRVRGPELGEHQPVLSGPDGRFTLPIESLPVDHNGQRRFAAQVVALHSYQPLAGRSPVQLDQPGDVLVTLEPHDPAWPLATFATETKFSEPGTGTDLVRPAISLGGQIPPDIDGALWLNTAGKSLTLASLRGRYVLLDFWFKGCGPCHHDSPSVRLAHQLYQDRGLTVVGIHLNVNTPAEVADHVATLGLPFPVMLDHPDGRTVAAYQAHGIAHICPSYVLIDPAGKVIADDHTIPGPTLRSFKLEILRNLLGANSPRIGPDSASPQLPR